MLLAAPVPGDERNPFWVYPVLLGGLALIGFFVRWLNRRYPSKKSFHGSIGNALVRMEATFLPGREHIAEVIEREDAEEDDEGEPPEAGNAGKPRIVGRRKKIS